MAMTSLLLVYVVVVVHFWPKTEFRKKKGGERLLLV